MARLQILEYPDPRLRTRAKPVEVFDSALARFAEDMLETMYAAPGIGLAATQVDFHKRLIVMDVSEGRNEPMTFCNPEIVAAEGTGIGEEGCLSVPGLRGRVPRFTRLRYTGFDPDGRPIQREVSGFHARVVQHECDHLDGVLYPMRMQDLSKLGFIEEMQRALQSRIED